MKRLLLIGALSLAFAVPAAQAATVSYTWSGSFHDQPVYYVTTTADGDISASTTYSLKSNVGVSMSIERVFADGTSDVLTRCYELATTAGVVGCTIPSAPAGTYKVTVDPYRGGKLSGVLTISGNF